MLFDGSRSYLHSEIQHLASKKYENYALVLIATNRVARLSIPIAHNIDLINTFVTKCYLMVSKAIFIVKSNTGLKKSMKITLKYS